MPSITGTKHHRRKQHPPGWTYDPTILRYVYQYPVTTYSATSTPSTVTVLDTAFIPPADAIYVAKTGNDTTGDGSAATPYLTFAKAYTVSSAGDTIVMRAGVYAEAFDISKNLTVQAYPHEQVWFSGLDTIATGSWTATGSQWSASGITDLRWTNTSQSIDQRSGYQVFFDGVRLIEIFAPGTATDVLPGYFFVNTTTDVLYIGSNPSGHTVQVTMRRRCYAHDCTRVTINGIGFLGFGSQLQDASLRFDQVIYPTVDSCTVAFGSNGGLSITATYDQHAVPLIKRTTCVYNGYIGVHGNHWKGGIARDCANAYNNTMHAMRMGATGNPTPSSDMSTASVLISNPATATGTNVALTIAGNAGFNGDTTNGSRIVKNVSTLTSSVDITDTISGTGIPGGSVISGLEVSNKATAGFENSWKLSLAEDCMVFGWHTHDNQGAGLWSDQWCDSIHFLFNKVHGMHNTAISNHGVMHELATRCTLISNEIRDCRFPLKHNESNRTQIWNNTAGYGSSRVLEVLETAGGSEKRRYPATALATTISGNATVTLSERYAFTTYASDNNNGTLYGACFPTSGARISAVTGTAGSGTVTMQAGHEPTATGTFFITNGDRRGDADGQVSGLVIKNNVLLNDRSGGLVLDLNDNSATTSTKRPAMEFISAQAGLDANCYYILPANSGSSMRFRNAAHNDSTNSLANFKAHAEVSPHAHEINGVEDHASASCVWVVDPSDPGLDGSFDYRPASIVTRRSGLTIPPAVADVIRRTGVQAGPMGSAIVAPHRGVIHTDYVTYAHDYFNRTTTNGWGTANVGGAWTASGTTSKFSTDTSGVARILFDTSATYRQTLAISVQDIEVLCSASLDVLPVTGRGAWYPIVRYVDANNNYRIEVQINTDSTVKIQWFKLIAGTSTAVGSQYTSTTAFAPGMSFSLRLRAVGINATRLQARIWPFGQDEPTIWHLNTTNSDAALQVAGGVGLRVAASGTAPTNFPLTYRFGEFLAIEPGA